MLMTTSTKSEPSAAMPPPSPPPGHEDEVIECTYTFEVGTGTLSVEDATCVQVDGQLLENIEHERSYICLQAVFAHKRVTSVCRLLTISEPAAIYLNAY